MCLILLNKDREREVKQPQRHRDTEEEKKIKKRCKDAKGKKKSCFLFFSVPLCLCGFIKSLFSVVILK
ncbi:MAG TPA: hypothetical protein DCQ99_07195 [Nitrospinae bacterium]|nr:hypothetical protein [Nitrospinota bacterium]